MIWTYLLMGLASSTTNLLTLVALRQPYGPTPWAQILGFTLGVVAWPVMIGFWVYRIYKPLPGMREKENENG